MADCIIASCIVAELVVVKRTVAAEVARTIAIGHNTAASSGPVAIDTAHCYRSTTDLSASTPTASFNHCNYRSRLAAARSQATELALVSSHPSCSQCSSKLLLLASTLAKLSFSEQLLPSGSLAC